MPSPRRRPPRRKSRGAERDDPCPINPYTIFEAMLFVGDGQNRSLSAQRAAELMRGVEPREIPGLVQQINQRYARHGHPYAIEGDGEGYYLALRPEFQTLRNRFFGQIREARLSQAAIDVLAIVAYQQPLTAEHRDVAGQAQRPRAGATGTPRPVADRAPGREASRDPIFHHRAFLEAFWITKSGRSAAKRGTGSAVRKRGLGLGAWVLGLGS